MIVTVPLAILKTNGITFDPELPDKKLRAIDKLGAGVIEKVRDKVLSKLLKQIHACEQVILKFPFAFWRKKVGDTDFFGRVAKNKEDRGLFPMFYDMARIYIVTYWLCHVTVFCRIPKNHPGNPQIIEATWLSL